MHPQDEHVVCFLKQRFGLGRLCHPMLVVSVAAVLMVVSSLTCLATSITITASGGERSAGVSNRPNLDTRHSIRGEEDASDPIGTGEKWRFLAQRRRRHRSQIDTNDLKYERSPGNPYMELGIAPKSDAKEDPPLFRRRHHRDRRGFGYGSAEKNTKQSLNKMVSSSKLGATSKSAKSDEEKTRYQWHTKTTKTSKRSRSSKKNAKSSTSTKKSKNANSKVTVGHYSQHKYTIQEERSKPTGITS